MSKHADTLIHGDDLYDCLDSDDNWEEADLADALGLELEDDPGNPGYQQSPIPTGWWLVSWPEHVVTPQYNSDASYSRVGDTLAEVPLDYNDAIVYGEYMGIAQLRAGGHLAAISRHYAVKERG